MGPVRPVDDLTIFTTITTTQSPKWRFQSMFNATKFVVAGDRLPAAASASASTQVEPTVKATGESEPAPEDTEAEKADSTVRPDVLPGTFALTGSLAEHRSVHTATLLPDGRVLVVGGNARLLVVGGNGRLPTSAEVWDPATASFSPAGSLAEARYDHTATLLPDGRVLVTGGEIGKPSKRGAHSAEVWDPTTAAFSPAGSLKKPRSRHTTTLLPDGRVLIVGGSNNESRRIRSAEVWDPATASLGPAGSLAEARGAHIATLLPDGRVLIVGGVHDDDTSAEVWDPATASFSPAGSFAKSLISRTATLLPDGRVFVIGGPGSDDDRLTSVEVWDPTTESFAPAGSLAGVAWYQPVTLLPDGRVLVVHDSAAEVWDPATASFSPAGSFVEAPRVSSTATLLPDGRVLVVGGLPQGLYAHGSAEVWEPGDG